MYNFLGYLCSINFGSSIWNDAGICINAHTPGGVVDVSITTTCSSFIYAIKTKTSPDSIAHSSWSPSTAISPTRSTSIISSGSPYRYLGLSYLSHHAFFWRVTRYLPCFAQTISSRPYDTVSHIYARPAMQTAVARFRHSREIHLVQTILKMRL